MSGGVLFLFGFLFGYARVYIKTDFFDWLIGWFGLVGWFGLDFIFLREEFKEVQQFNDLIQNLIFSKAF